MITINLKLVNGDNIEYRAQTIKDPIDGIEKVKLLDHYDSIKNLVLTHLSLPLDNSNTLNFFFPNEEEEMLSMYLYKYENDPGFRTKMYLCNLLEKDEKLEKEILKKYSDKTSIFYYLMYSDLMKEKFYTEDVTLNIVIDNSNSMIKDLKDRYSPNDKCSIM